MDVGATNTTDINLVTDPVGSRCQKLFQDFLAQSVFKIKHLRPITHCTPQPFLPSCPNAQALAEKKKRNRTFIDPVSEVGATII